MGSGIGTFARAYPQFQPHELGGFSIHNVHNDYLEALFEGGIFTLLLMLSGTWILLRQWPRLLRQGSRGARWGNFRFIQAGAGIGVSLMLLHSLVDFNLHIPANAIFFSFLAAVFLKEYSEEEGGRRRRRRSASLEESPRYVTEAERSPEWEAEKNPFAD